MNTAFLALDQTPPLSVPLRFFLTAPLFGLLASLLLFYDGPQLFISRWSPNTLALTHLVMLGFVTMVMFGALQQLLPILVIAPLPRPTLVSATLHILLTLGTLSLAAGFLISAPWMMRSAIVLLGLAFLGLISVLAYCLIPLKGKNPIVTAMRVAISALAVTAVLGIGLGMLFAYHIVLPFPTVLTDLHLTWGLIGWVGLLIMGIAYQVVPMFQITPHYPTALTPWFIPLIFLCLVFWTPLYILAELNKIPSIIPQILVGFMGLGLSVFAIVTLKLQAQRLRSIPDITLNYWRMGMVCLLLSVVLWLISVLSPVKTLSPMLLVVLFIAGFVLSVIQGMLYKIVPFLVWLHLQNQQLDVLTVIKVVKIPNMKQIIPDKLARRQFWVYVFALGLLIGAVLWPSALSQAAGIVLFCSFLLLTYNLYNAIWLYGTVSRRNAVNKT